MKRLHNRDIVDIFNLFENEFLTIRDITKIEQMRIRKKVKDILNPLLRAPIYKAEDVLIIVEEKLYEVINYFRNREEFLIKLSDMLKSRLTF